MATYTVTNTFVADTTADGPEVSANFTDLLTALNAFDASNLASGTVPLAHIANLTTSEFAANVVDTDDTLAADSDTRLPSQQAAKGYIDTEGALSLPDDDAFGAWELKSNAVVYQADSDGYVIAAVLLPFSTATLSVTTDSSNPPVTVRAKNRIKRATYTAVTVPVKKGDYWITANAFRSVYWIPIGAP